MNTTSFLLLALLGCLLASPALAVSFRFVHGAPNMAPVNVFVDGDLKWSSIQYSWVVDSIDVNSDTPVLFEIYTAQTNILLLSFEVPVQVPTSVVLIGKGERSFFANTLDIGDNTPDYTIYLDSVADKNDIEAKSRPIPFRQTNIQVISLLPFGSSVTISNSRSNGALFSGVTALEQVLYTPTNAGILSLSFQDDASGATLISQTNIFGGNSYNTLWMFGDVTSQDFVLTISNDNDHVETARKLAI